MNIVWFKKDLRATDHKPLQQAIASGKTVALFIFEPEWFASAEFDVSHLRFCWQSLQDLKEDLNKKGVPLIFRSGSVIQVFSDLIATYPIDSVYSHEETGLDWTYQRDLKLKSFLKDHSIGWIEHRQFGVIRRLKDRDNWNHLRSTIIERQTIIVPCQQNVLSPWDSHPPDLDHLIKSRQIQDRQIGGRKHAIQYLRSFLNERGENYFSSISSPLKAFDGCSRLSPYLTWGNLSITEVHHAIQKKRSQIDSDPHFPQAWKWKRSLEQFESRIWWHCHFIQKLESEPDIEFHNFNREFDGLRESEFNQEYFESWCKGQTGFPMIDACMRALHQHGWINFRMRAMLLSFASYQLWLHWKKPAEFLAKNFLDFEPGIHYSQCQMQSGVTGINSIRIYSPSKQAMDQDPNGDFIRKYVPELSSVPASDIAEPYHMPPLIQMDCQFRLGETYPHPIVDPKTSYEMAKQRIFDWKKKDEVKNYSKLVLHKHGSRKGKHFPTQNRMMEEE